MPSTFLAKSLHSYMLLAMNLFLLAVVSLPKLMDLKTLRISIIASNSVNIHRFNTTCIIMSNN